MTRLRHPASWLLLLAVLLVLAGVSAWPSSAAGPGADPVGAWPLQPRPEVVSGFDPPDLPWGSGHRGVDLLGRPGQEVHTALAGQVTYAGLLAGRGVVVVDHGDTRTTYEPVSAGVAVGASLPRGAVIGTLAASGSHCPPQACLHWGWLRGEVYLDPLDLVHAGAVRLLPLWRDDPVDRLPGRIAPSSLPTFEPYLALLARFDTLLRLLAGPAVLPHRESRALGPYARGCACW